MFKFVSIKIRSEPKPLIAGIASVWSAMGFTMAAEIEAISQKDNSKKSGETYLYFPRVVKVLEQDSQVISPLI
jgi:hypothetical protein